MESPTSVDDPIFNAGVEEGRQQVRKEVLSHLEEQYMSNDIARSSPEAVAILDVAKSISTLLKKE